MGIGSTAGGSAVTMTATAANAGTAGNGLLVNVVESTTSNFGTISNPVYAQAVYNSSYNQNGANGELTLTVANGASITNAELASAIANAKDSNGNSVGAALASKYSVSFADAAGDSTFTLATASRSPTTPVPATASTLSVTGGVTPVTATPAVAEVSGMIAGTDTNGYTVAQNVDITFTGPTGDATAADGNGTPATGSASITDNTNTIQVSLAANNTGGATGTLGNGVNVVLHHVASNAANANTAVLTEAPNGALTVTANLTGTETAANIQTVLSNLAADISGGTTTSTDVANFQNNFTFNVQQTGGTAGVVTATALSSDATFATAGGASGLVVQLKQGPDSLASTTITAHGTDASPLIITLATGTTQSAWKGNSIPTSAT